MLRTCPSGSKSCQPPEVSQACGEYRPVQGFAAPLLCVVVLGITGGENVGGQEQYDSKGKKHKTEYSREGNTVCIGTVETPAGHVVGTGSDRSWKGRCSP